MKTNVELEEVAECLRIGAQACAGMDCGVGGQWSQDRLRILETRALILADEAGTALAALKDLAAWFKSAPDGGALAASEHLLGGCPNDLAASIDKARAAIAESESAVAA